MYRIGRSFGWGDWCIYIFLTFGLCSPHITSWMGEPLLFLAYVFIHLHLHFYVDNPYLVGERINNQDEMTRYKLHLNVIQAALHHSCSGITWALLTVSSVLISCFHHVKVNGPSWRPWTAYDACDQYGATSAFNTDALVFNPYFSFYFRGCSCDQA